MNRALLIILDGWGINSQSEHNPTAKADPVFWNKLLAEYPHSVLRAREESVGLIKGFLSGSQVGHLTIAAGRIVRQSGAKINDAILDKSFSQNQILEQVQNHLQSFGSALHLIGMLSSGGVHAHLDHLLALIDWAKQKKIKTVALHLFLDGRDMPPKSAQELLKKITPHLNDQIKISTLSGRLFGMDRNENWSRTLQAFSVITKVANPQSISPAEYIEKSYQEEISDEFIMPANFTDKIVNQGDALLFFNFRADRMRQLARLFADKAPNTIKHDITVPRNLLLASMTEYADEFTGVHVLFPQEIPENTLGEWISKQGLKQFRITETEKFAHLTFFFNGGREVSFPGETRLMIPSLRVRDFAANPEMSLPEITATLIRAIEDETYDFILCNFANGDMVGHSGNMVAAMKAVTAVDRALSQIAPMAEKHNYTTVITADHGNIEQMYEADSPHTAHTYNDVPLLILDKKIKLNNNGYLHQVAPTILELMALPKPEEMTSESLIKK